MSSSDITKTYFADLQFVKSGKVRDIYNLGEYYLIVSTDRLSAFDVIMNEGIPEKGKVLNRISCFWFNYVKDIIENHLITSDVNLYPKICHKYSDDLKQRSMLVKKAELIPIECIVRGYITGSGLIDYQKTGMICGIKLPQGLVESEKLAQPLFTPSTKADIGLHDENITDEQAASLISQKTYEILKETTIRIYSKCAEYALSKGIIIADTKMEFGYYQGKIILIDELLTPDSSRFWPLDQYAKGKVQNSFDKQYVRDYLIKIGFNKQPPAPALPEEVISNTSAKYLDALYKLTGETIS